MLRIAAALVCVTGCGDRPITQRPVPVQPVRPNPTQPKDGVVYSDMEIWCYRDGRTVGDGFCSRTYEDCESAKAKEAAPVYAANVSRLQRIGLDPNEAKARAIRADPFTGCVEATSAACFEMQEVVSGFVATICTPNLTTCMTGERALGEPDYKLVRSCFVWRKR